MGLSLYSRSPVLVFDNTLHYHLQHKYTSIDLPVVDLSIAFHEHFTPRDRNKSAAAREADAFTGPVVGMVKITRKS